MLNKINLIGYNYVRGRLPLDEASGQICRRVFVHNRTSVSFCLQTCNFPSPSERNKRFVVLHNNNERNLIIKKRKNNNERNCWFLKTPTQNAL